tara:strand:+ start:12059 stop:13165 length:1107 start_codon:yes stop_codon:yes gene_type:complete
MTKHAAVIFRADASLNIGSGHIMRCLTLADTLREQGADCRFICRQHPGHLCDLIEARGFVVHRLPFQESIPDQELTHAHWLGASWSEDAAACQSILSELSVSWLVVDHYALDSRWEGKMLCGLTDPAINLLVIDDLADRPHVANLLLDQNLGRSSEDYLGLVPEDCEVLVGPRYALLRPEFQEWREASLARRANPAFQQLLINLGGVDKDNVTGQVLQKLRTCDLPSNLKICVVMGATAPWREAVSTQARDMPWPTQVIINADCMASHMTAADFAIGAAGSTAWERCALGLPTLMLTLAENQKPIAKGLQDAGAAVCLGTQDDLDALPDRMAALTQVPALETMTQAAARVTEGSGTMLVCRTMLEQRV